jgi:hypothetical protein
MQMQRPTRRLIAFQLLVILPAVMGVRAALDFRTVLTTTHQVKAEHSGCGAQAHDHRLCLLVYRAPWSDAPSTPDLSLPFCTVKQPTGESVVHIDRELRLQLARAPPVSA